MELHELRLLRSVVRSIYMDSADVEDDSEVEDATEDQVPAGGGLRPFIPPLINSDPLETVQEDDESSSREHSVSSAHRIPPITGQYQSKRARYYQSQLA